MRLLFLANNLAQGGAEKVLVNLANELSKRGHEVTVRTLVNSGENKQYLLPAIKYEYVFSKLVFGLNYLHLLPHRWIYQKVCKGEYDLVIPYLHGVLTRIVSYAPAEQKTVAWLHANMCKSPFMLKLIQDRKVEQCFSSYSRIVAVSEDVKKSFVDMTGITDRLQVLYNTFDVDGIRNKAIESVDWPEYMLNETAICLCSVGKLEHIKGYERLLKILKRLVTEDGMKITLCVVGEGPQRGDLEKYVIENRLENTVYLPGLQDNPYKYISKADLFVCSSYTEGFSSVVAESLILGVPVITTECPGMREMLGDNEYGMITENSDEGLYAGLKQLLSNPELLKHYTKKAKDRREFFSPEQTISAVERVFKEVINE